MQITLNGEKITREHALRRKREILYNEMVQNIELLKSRITDIVKDYNNEVKIIDKELRRIK